MPNILDSSESIGGYSQQELAEIWGIQTFSTPGDTDPSVNIHPFVVESSDSLDPRGKRGTIENHENFNADSPDGVNFLGGVFNGEAGVTRTIVGNPDVVYFAPFVNQFGNNTTIDSSPDTDFPGGFALTPQHRDDLLAQDLNPRPSLFGQDTLLESLKFLIDGGFKDEDGNPIPGIDGQFVNINGIDHTPANIESFRQETANVSYEDLPFSTGEFEEFLFGDIAENIFVADPDLGEGLDNDNPFDDRFPTLAELNPSFQNHVLPSIQIGYYFALELERGSFTIEFGAPDSFIGAGVINTYNVLNPIEGTKGRDCLTGTSGNDYIDGGKGRDRLSGEAGDDLILGGKGADVINGGAGNDELWGDKGRDKFIYTSGKDTIFDFENHEVVKIRGFEEFDDDDDFEDLIEDIILPSGVSAARIDFGSGNILHIVGVSASALEIDDGEISLDDFDDDFD